MTPLAVPLTPLSFLERSGVVFAHRTAIVDGRRRLSFRDMAALTQRTADAFRSWGLRPGDRVAYLAPNSAELIVAHFAVPLAGGVLVALNTRLSPSEIRTILAHSGARLLAIDPGLVHHVADLDLPEGIDLVTILPDADGTAVPIAIPPGTVPWPEFLDRATGSVLPWTADSEEGLIALNYTSGTTGDPKGAMYTHRGAYLNALSEIHHQGLTSGSVYLWTLPLFHCNGWCSAWASVAAGTTQVCLRAVDGDEIWRVLRAEGVTHLCGAPTVLRILDQSPEAGPLDHPLTAITAGAPPSPRLIRRFLDLGVTVTHVYGLTESYGPYTVCEPQEHWAEVLPELRAGIIARQGVGMLTAHRVRIVTGDVDLVDVPADGRTIGEIVLRGNTVMAGYYNDPKATAHAFRGGWFHTGDLGVMHPDGYIEVVDRVKDIIISGGENISSIEVERVLADHPAVAEVAVVGIPDEFWGDVPRAFVVARQPLSSADLIAFARERLAHYKAPRSVVFVDALPRTSTGKVRKAELRHAALVAAPRTVGVWPAAA